MNPTSPTRRAATVLVAALLGALVAWLLASTGSRSLDEVERTDALSDVPETSQTPAPQAGSPTTRVRARPASPAAPRVTGPVPARLTIPRLGVVMPVTPQGVDEDGAMALPESAFEVGWYRFGPRPSDRAGATVLAGHVDTAEEGPGPLARLGSLRPGDRIAVRAGTRTVTYAVTAVDRIGKAVLDLPAVFARNGAPRLHLVTCGGEYDAERGGYQDNVVVSARRLPG